MWYPSRQYAYDVSLDVQRKGGKSDDERGMRVKRGDTPERRAPLNRDRVLRRAMRLADAGGIASISMRRLGQALGVEAMSLYNHVANKDDILDGITDLVVREIELPSSTAEWDVALRRSAMSAHDVLLRHPWACSLAMSPLRDVPARIGFIDAILGCLRRAGFSPQTTYHAYHALDSHILGFTLWEVGHSTGTEDLAGLATTFLEQLPEGAYPHLVEHAELHLSRSGPDGRDEFGFGLDLILDGLKRMRASFG